MRDLVDEDPLWGVYVPDVGELEDELEDSAELENEELELDELVEMRGKLERQLEWVKAQLQQRLQED